MTFNVVNITKDSACFQCKQTGHIKRDCLSLGNVMCVRKQVMMETNVAIKVAKNKIDAQCVRKQIMRRIIVIL